MSDKFDEEIRQIVSHRKEAISDLCRFVLTDTVLFCSKDIISEKEKLYEVVRCANEIMSTKYVITENLCVSQQNRDNDEALRQYLEFLFDDKFAILCLVAFEVRSVLLAVLFVENRINVDEIFNLAFFEELFQQGKWGKDEIIIERQKQIKQRLYDLEKIKDERSLS